jgi:hypothetical protein
MQASNPAVCSYFVSTPSHMSTATALLLPEHTRHPKSRSSQHPNRVVAAPAMASVGRITVQPEPVPPYPLPPLPSSTRDLQATTAYASAGVVAGPREALDLSSCGGGWVILETRVVASLPLQARGAAGDTGQTAQHEKMGLLRISLITVQSAATLTAELTRCRLALWTRSCISGEV